MTFLQPLILWGLPLVLLPVIIHLINRMRHRPRQWAAMQFLLAATRSSTSHAKLRNLLIMLMRILAVLALLIFLARPLVGGWMGWALAAAPDTILLLVDRSASMESRVAGADESRREYALKMLADAAGEFEHASHLVLLDSATRQASELPSAASLLEWPDTQPTDTAADLPAMLQTALDWLIENKAGTAEIWIASDLQASNWQPDDPRWETLITAFDSLPQKVRMSACSPPRRSRPTTPRSPSRNSPGNRPPAKCAWPSISIAARPTPAPPRSPAHSTASPPNSRPGSPGSPPAGGIASPSATKRAAGVNSSFRPTATRATTSLTTGTATTTRRPAWSSPGVRLARCGRQRHRSTERDGRTPAKRYAPGDVTPADLRDATLVVWQAPSAGGREWQARCGGSPTRAAALFSSRRASHRRPVLPAWAGVKNKPAATPVLPLAAGTRIKGRWPTPTRGCCCRWPSSVFGSGNRSLARRRCWRRSTMPKRCSSAKRLARGKFIFAPPCPCSPGRRWATAWWSCRCCNACSPPGAAGCSATRSPSAAKSARVICNSSGRRPRPVCAATCKRRPVFTKTATAGCWSTGRPPRMSSSALRTQAVAGLFGSLPFQLFQAQRDDTALQGEIWRLFLFLMLLALLIEAWLIRPGPIPPPSSMAEAAPLPLPAGESAAA